MTSLLSKTASMFETAGVSIGAYLGNVYGPCLSDVHIVRRHYNEGKVDAEALRRYQRSLVLTLAASGY
jgi:hypothetical protein